MGHKALGHPSPIEPGTRVHVLRHSLDTSVPLTSDGDISPLAYIPHEEQGTYLGEFPYDKDGGMVRRGQRNPKIQLDSGETTWGCECWWDPVDPAV